MPPFGTVTFTARDPRVRVSALMGDGPIKIQYGGGWVIVARPRRVGITEWQGEEPKRMQLPIMLDGFATGESVTDEAQKLERIRGVPKGETEPPIIKVSGAVPHAQEEWVMEQLEWGDQMVRRESGHLIRADATITLLQYVADERLSESIRRRGKKKRKRGRGGKTYTVKRGDSLRKIAIKVYKDPEKWRAIASENNIRDPRNIKVGQKLRLP